MDNSKRKSQKKAVKRAVRVRAKLRGRGERPRLCVVKSNCHLQAQIIDDERGMTLGGLSTFSKEFRDAGMGRKNKDTARKLGARIAEIAKGQDIEKVIFDRGSSKYHGVVAAFADGAREGGLQF